MPMLQNTTWLILVLDGNNNFFESACFEVNCYFDIVIYLLITIFDVYFICFKTKGDQTLCGIASEETNKVRRVWNI